MKRPSVFSGTLLLALAALPALPSPSPAQVHALTSTRDPLVSFQPVRGHIRVVGWDRDSVRIVVEDAGSVRVDIERSGASAVRILERRRPGDPTSPRYALFVPRAATVRVSAQEGSLHLSGLAGVFRGGLVDGPLSADSLAGDMELSSVTGPVEVRNSRGHLEARSPAGRVSLLNVTGSIRVRATSGEVRVQLAGRSTVNIESYSGRVSVAGILGGGASSVATHSGDIEIQLPFSGGVTLFATGARIRAPATCQTGASRTDTAGPLTLGAGDDPLELATFSGTVTVRCAAAAPR